MVAEVGSFSLEYPCGTRQNAHWLIPGPIPSGMGPFCALTALSWAEGSFHALTALARAEGSCRFPARAMTRLGRRCLANRATAHSGGLPSGRMQVRPMREGWWACLDLNQGPSGYEPVALTTELQALRADSNASHFSRL